MPKKLVACVLAAVCLLGLTACKSKGPAATAGAEKDWYRYISAFTAGTIFRKIARPGPLRRQRGDPGSGRRGAPRILAGDRRDGGVDEARASSSSPPRASSNPARSTRPSSTSERILDLPKAFARFEFRFSVVRPEHGGRARGLFAEDPEPAAGPGPARPGRHGRHGGEGPGREGPRGRAGRQGPCPSNGATPMEGLTHYFTVRDIERREEASAVNLSWDGAPIRIDNRGRRAVRGPGHGRVQGRLRSSPSSARPGTSWCASPTRWPGTRTSRGSSASRTGR